ncbi:MAG: LemA family protein [Actinobacteria bacterium]|nr:LemA family protein [Actinomycetota bacterium]
MKVVAGVGAAVLVLVSLIGAYNGLVDKDARVDQASADLEVQLQRRFDLIPNLVAAVEGAMSQEREVFASLADARAGYAGASGGDEKIAAAAQLESALGRLLAIVENYPELSSTQNVRDLQVQLEGTENRVAQARRDYNEAATSLNRSVRSFPTSIAAGVFGFERRALFEAVDGSDTAPSVDLNP